MAVAVKNASEASPQSPLQRHRLAVNSLAGALYVLGSIGLVFYGIPEIWSQVVVGGSFVLVALQLVVMLAAATGLTFLGLRLVGPKPEKGLRSGIFLGCLGLLAVAYATFLVGKLLEATFFGDPSRYMAGMIATLVIGAGFLYLLGRYFMRPRFEETAAALEEQGWFTAEGYKRSQGQRVRRGTMLGILILAGCGLYTLEAHRTLYTIGYQKTLNDPSTWVNGWALWLPFTGTPPHMYVPILSDVRYTVPLLLAAAALWFAYRVVNYPTFADFLIATEAEINKVSWTTRKRLVQDTIVVLTTVILLTVFLFVVDLAWSKVLTWVGVLRPATTQQESKVVKPW
jgi:preprotein translocase SecE subunit